MENYNFDLGLNPAPAKKRGWIWKVTGIMAGIVIVAGLLVYSGGMESILKLLGVGASGILDTTITSTQDFTGNAAFFADGSQPGMEGATVVDQFTGTPADPNQNEKNKGFVIPIFSSPQDPTQEIYKEHFYVSSPIDMTLATSILSAVEVTQFNSESSNITYAYRTAAQPSQIVTAQWQPLDPSVVNSTSPDNVQVKTAIVEQSISRFVQIKCTFENPDPMQRNAVYALSLQYKDGEAVGSGGMTDANASERTIAVQYDSTNAPTNADIDIISADLSNKTVYTQKQVDLSERLSYTFQVALVPGAYALVLSSPATETQIVPFMASASGQIEVKLGSFAAATGQDSTYDLNGDGQVNSLDLMLLMSKFTS